MGYHFIILGSDSNQTSKPQDFTKECCRLFEIDSKIVNTDYKNPGKTKFNYQP